MPIAQEHFVRPSTTAFPILLSSSIPTGSSFPPIPRSRSNSVMHRMKSPTVRCGYFMLRMMTTTPCLSRDARERAGEDVSDGVYQYRRKDGSVFSGRLRVTAVTGEDGAGAGLHRCRARHFGYSRARQGAKEDRRYARCRPPGDPGRLCDFRQTGKAASPSMKPIAAFWARPEMAYRPA